MNSVPSHIDELIAKHLAFETTPTEMESLELWLNESEENRRYYESMETLLWGANDEALVGKTKEWIEFRKQIKAPRKPLTISRWYFAAAAILILALIGYLKLKPSAPVLAINQPKHLVTQEGILIDTLEDGSIITLNHHSEIIIEPGFNQSHRTMRLSGEAFFDIGKSSAAPFIILTSSAEIRDIGTSFSVNTNIDSALTINVATGKVALMVPQHAPIEASAGMQLTYNHLNQQSSITSLDANAMGFKTHLFEFKNQTLASLLSQLQSAYGVSLSCDEAIRDCAITVNFKNEKIETIIDIISETLHVKYDRLNGGFHLAGNKCN